MTRPWTTAEIRRLHVEHAAGLSITDLAALHGRTRGAIKTRLHTEGLSRRRSPARPWTPLEDATLRGHHAAGTRFGDIATALERTVLAIERRVYALRLPPRRFAFGRSYLFLLTLRQERSNFQTSERHGSRPNLEPAMTFFIATEPGRDLSEAGARNTPAAQAAFAAAFERAAAKVGEAAGVEIEVHIGGSANYSEAFRNGLREQDGDVADLLWQSVHDCVVESRPGRWTVNKTSVASTAAWLRRKAASM